jgi:hypothetical protein
VSVLPTLVSGLEFNNLGFDSAANYLLWSTCNTGLYGIMGWKLDWAEEVMESDVG